MSGTKGGATASASEPEPEPASATTSDEFVGSCMTVSGVDGATICLAIDEWLEDCLEARGSEAVAESTDA